MYCPLYKNLRNKYIINEESQSDSDEIYLISRILNPVNVTDAKNLCIFLKESFDISQKQFNFGSSLRMVSLCNMSFYGVIRTIIKSFLYIYTHQYLYTCIVIVCEHGLRIVICCVLSNKELLLSLL